VLVPALHPTAAVVGGEPVPMDWWQLDIGRDCSINHDSKAQWIARPCPLKKAVVSTISLSAQSVLPMSVVRGNYGSHAGSSGAPREDRLDLTAMKHALSLGLTCDDDDDSDDEVIQAAGNVSRDDDADDDAKVDESDSSCEEDSDDDDDDDDDEADDLSQTQFSTRVVSKGSALKAAVFRPSASGSKASGSAPTYRRGPLSKSL
jgi:hypothetical protein